MPQEKTLYYQVIKFLIEHSLLPNYDDKLFISYKYSDMKFSPPRTIKYTTIIYLFNLDKQIVEFRKNGLLRFLEIEPVEVVKNYRVHDKLPV